VEVLKLGIRRIRGQKNKVSTRVLPLMGGVGLAGGTRGLTTTNEGGTRIVGALCFLEIEGTFKKRNFHLERTRRQRRTSAGRRFGCQEQDRFRKKSGVMEKALQENMLVKGAGFEKKGHLMQNKANKQCRGGRRAQGEKPRDSRRSMIVIPIAAQ